MQFLLFDKTSATRAVEPFSFQLLKWIGNKQRFAHEIVAFFPSEMDTYYEPFLGSGGVLGTLAPERAIASDVFEPLIGIWKAVKEDPAQLKLWYEERWRRFIQGDRTKEYESIRRSYNASPNSADLLFLSRSCYGGVVRFRQNDGFMSTPCGPHTPVSPSSFSARVDEWTKRVSGTTFEVADFAEMMLRTRKGDFVYCDPPYVHSQTILYGAQSFQLERLLTEIEACKNKGVSVALSIDGSKKSGAIMCDLPIPRGLFEREVYLNCGRSMLRRFQMNGQSLVGEVVSDRLLLTY